MTRLRACGFETGDASEIRSLSGTASIQSTVKRTGGYALRVNPTTTGTGSATLFYYAASGDGQNGPAVVATQYVRMYLRIDTLPAASEEMFFTVVGTGSAPTAYSLRVTSGGLVKLVRGESLFGDAESTVATGTTVLSTGTFYRIELKLGSGATAAYEVRINGSTEFSGTTNANTNTGWNQWLFGKWQNKNGQTVDFYFDDVSIDDAAFPGAGEVHLLKPRAAGSSAQWTTGTGSTFAEVDEVPHDSDTTYIKNSTNGNASSFAMDSSSTGSVAGTIAAVQTLAIVRDEGGASSVKVRLRNGTTNRDTTGADPGASYVALGRIDTTDPNTGAAWTSSGLDTIECGVVNGASVAARCTAIYAMVECAGAPANTAPTITAGPTVTYASGTDTRPGNTWGVTFTASDAESTGADALTYYVRTSATFGGGTQVATGTCTSGTSKVVTGLTWDASGLIEGSQTLYLHILDGGGANTASAGTFTLYAINYTAGGTKWIARKFLSRADTNGITIKPAAGIVGPITLINTSGAARYLHLYDATQVVVGTTVPAFTIEIPAGTLRWGSDNGITFSTGICYSLTTGAGDSDTGAVGANEITGVICWY